MSDSDDESNKEEWVPFSKRPEWSDVQPIPQDEGPDPVCPIAYSPKFSETMDYFRAVLHSEEKSERVLNLIKEVIAVNSANYTAWCFRRAVLFGINADLREELKYVTSIGRSNPKNYQLWHHRRLIVEKLDDPSEELAFTAAALEEDGKNYHAWAHRQWVVETYKLWDNELHFVDDLIKTDMRNNSAWNQRFFVASKWKQLAHDVIAAEIEYSFYWIRKAPNNQSPWLYLKGLLLKEKFSTFPAVKENCLVMKDQYVGCSHVLSLLIDIAEQDATTQSITEALEYCKVLHDRVDVLHGKYWNYRQQKLNEKLAQLSK